MKKGRGGSPRRFALAMAMLGLAASMLAPSHRALAQDKIRIGVIGPFSGPFANVGVMFKQGIETYQAVNGTKVGGRDVEFLYRDTAGTNPAVAKQLAEELIVRDKAQILSGFYLTPEAIAAAPVVNETKTPAVLFFAGGAGVTKLTHYYIRTGSTNPTHAAMIADYALKQGWKRVYIAVADYAPGYDMQAVYKQRVTDAGGTVLAEDRLPLNTVDYAPFAERIANAKPDAVLGFVPNGAPAVAWYKALAAQNILPKTPVIGISETDDTELKNFDDSVVGAYSAIFYSSGAPGAANATFKEALAKTFPGSIPNFGRETAYDAMHIVYAMIDSQKGKAWDGTAALEAVQGLSWEAPRGKVRINPNEGEMQGPIYVRRIEKVNGELKNVIVDVFPDVVPLR